VLPLPDYLRPEWIDPHDEWISLCQMLHWRGSLPFVHPDYDLDEMGDAGVRALAGTLDDIHVRLARTRADAFVQYVMRHERDNSPLLNAPFHKEWHAYFDENPRAILEAPVEHAKTQQIAVGRSLFALGQDRNRRLAIVSLTQETHADKIAGQIRRCIDRNPRLRRVFPHLRKSPLAGDQWGASRLYVERDTNSKDPSIGSYGLFGPINGSRLDGIILDDLLNFENTRSIAQMKKIVGWLDSEVLQRVTPDGFVWWIGTPWREDDPMHEVAKRAGWVSRSYSAVTNHESPMEEWKPLWPSQFSRERLIKRYEETTPIDFARMLLCQVRTKKSARFQADWIEHAKELGRGTTLVDQAPHYRDGRRMRCFTGVDVGIGQTENHDLSCVFTIGAIGGKRHVLKIDTGNWDAPTLIDKISTHKEGFDSIVYVENNAAQDFLVQWSNQMGVYVQGVTTTAKRKYDSRFGVEHIAIEMRNGGWVIPSGDDGQTIEPEVREWIREMLYYTPDAHTGDRLMASWIAREASRRHGIPVMGHATTMRR